MPTRFSGFAQSSPSASQRWLRPREGPRRAEDVGEVAPRLAEAHLERPVVERLGGLDVLHQEGGARLQLAHAAPGVGIVLCRQRLAVAPFRSLADSEQVGEPVRGDAEVVRHRGHDVQLRVDHQEPAEEQLGEVAGLGRVDVAGGQLARAVGRGLEPLGGRQARVLADAARERLVVHLLGALEVEGEVVGERHLEERVARAALVADPRQEGARPAVVLERFLVRVDRAGGVAGLQEVVDGLLGLVGLLEVPGEKPVGLLRRLLVDLLERLAHALVQLAALRVDEARVGDLLDEAVAEAVLGVRPAALLDDQVEPLQVGQCLHELVAVHEPLQQRQPERPPDDRGDREDVARLAVEAVEARLQRPLDDRGDGQLVLGDRELPPAVSALEHAPLDEVAEGLLEEERVAARALREQLGDRLGQLAVGRVRDEHARGVRRERAHLDLPVAVRVALPRELAEPPGAVLPLGAVDEEERDRGLVGHAEDRLEQLDRRFVGPVEILEDQAERLLVGELADELEEDLERAGLDALAVQLPDRLRRLGLERQADEVGDERIGVVRLLAPEEVRQLGLELEAHAGLGRRGADAEPLAQQLADGPVGEGLGVGDAAGLDEAHAVAIAVAHLPDQPGLADSRARP